MIYRFLLVCIGRNNENGEAAMLASLGNSRRENLNEHKFVGGAANDWSSNVNLNSYASNHRSNPT